MGKNHLQRRHRRGANMIEFGLTLPIFLFSTFVMFELGWYFSRMAAVNSEVATACRNATLIDPGDPPNRSRGGGDISGASGRNTVALAATLDLQAAIAGYPELTCLDCSAAVSGAPPNVTVRCNARVSYQDITGITRMPGLSWVIPTQVNRATQVRLEYQRI